MKRPGGGPARERPGPFLLLRQKNDEGLDSQLKDRQYLQRESEMSYVHRIPPGLCRRGDSRRHFHYLRDM